MSYVITNFEREILGVPIIRDVFIETGSNEGNTMNAAHRHFKECHSIDILPRMYEYCKNIFSNHPHIHYHLGNSPEILPKIMDKTRATTFWLDAHFFEVLSEDELENTLDSVECPLLDELRVILAVDWDIKPMIMIDDAVMFQEEIWGELPSCFHKEKWPRQQEIEDILKDYKLAEDDGILYFV